jgi:transformation/transcription domain-associated protein
MEAVPVGSPSMNWEPVCQGLVGGDLATTLKTAQDLKADKVPLAELPLMLSALLPVVSTVLTSKTSPTSDPNSLDHQVRACLLKWMAALPTNEAVHPHAPHLVAVAMDVLTRDYEDNAIAASRILFNLFKSYRSLPPDFVQPYLDFVVSLYGGVPNAIERNFATVKSGKDDDVEMTDAAAVLDTNESSKIPATFPAISSTSRPQFKSISSFRVLTECPLVVIFIIQLYPSYVENSTTVPSLIRVMMEALSQRPPALHSLVPEPDSSTKRLYLSTVRDLVAAQAKTLSFLIYLLRTFTKELKPYENQLAANVVALIRSCPRESIGTRRELLVATRHLLNSEFRTGFFHHIDAFLDERVLTGNRSVVRSMAFQMLSDLIHHVRGLLSMKQMTRVVGMYCRILHDTSLPLSSQNAAVRTLLNLVETIFQNKDPDGQLGRDMLIRLLFTFVEKLEGLQHLSNRSTSENDESLRDIPALIRIIIVGLKTIISFICEYRAKRFETMQPISDRPPIKAGSNEEVSSAAMKVRTMKSFDE